MESGTPALTPMREHTLVDQTPRSSGPELVGSTHGRAKIRKALLIPPRSMADERDRMRDRCRRAVDPSRGRIPLKREEEFFPMLITQIRQFQEEISDVKTRIHRNSTIDFITKIEICIANEQEIEMILLLNLLESGQIRIQLAIS
jgi:hypothetical protein